MKNTNPDYEMSLEYLAMAYKMTRQVVGMQSTIAKELQIDRGTITRRENGHLPVTRESALALSALIMCRIRRIPIIFPDSSRLAVEGFYGIYEERGLATVVLCHYCILNNDYGRNVAVNRILQSEFSGIREHCIRVICVVNVDSEHPDSKEYGLVVESSSIKRKLKNMVDGGEIINPVVSSEKTYKTVSEMGAILPREETFKHLEKARLIYVPKERE